MITSKGIAEKIHMFYNLLYHLDDYIKNKKERKGQLRVSKNIRLILREIISSKINLNYFINKEELDSYRDLFDNKIETIISKEQLYIKKVNPLSFNQKNLHTVNLFYNSNNELFIINYLVLDKILSIIKFCFVNIIKQKNKEHIEKLEKKYKNDFVLYHIDDEGDTDNKKTEEKIINKNNDDALKMQLKTDKKLRIDINRINQNNINKFSPLNIPNILNNKNNLSLYNILSSPNNNNDSNSNNKIFAESFNDLRKNINKMNSPIYSSLIKTNTNNTNRVLSKNNFKKNLSLPLIMDNKRIDFHSNEKNKNIQNIKFNINIPITSRREKNIENNIYKFLLNSGNKNKGNIKTSLSNLKIKK